MENSRNKRSTREETCNYLSDAALLTSRETRSRNVENVHYAAAEEQRASVSHRESLGPRERTKGSVSLAAMAMVFPFRSGVSSRDAISHLPSTCSPRVLSRSASPSFAGSRLSSKFSGSHTYTRSGTRVPRGLRFSRSILDLPSPRIFLCHVIYANE